MNRRFFLGLVLVGAFFFLALPWGHGQEGEKVDPEKVARSLFEDHWRVEGEKFANLERCLPGVHPFFAILQGKGGVPYAKVLISGKGEVLVLTKTRDLIDRAGSKILEAEPKTFTPPPKAFRGAGGSGLNPTVSAFAKYAAVRATDPGNALSLAVL
ncbi:MAG: hypothetical protein ACYTHM_05230, partial [Planctomycetota bacterium]